MNKNSLYIASFAFLLFVGQVSSQDHLWTFDEGTGTTSADFGTSRHLVNAVLNNAQWKILSKIGPGAAVRITGDDNSYISFGNGGNGGQYSNDGDDDDDDDGGFRNHHRNHGDIGQFGTNDFSVAFWFQTRDNSVALVDLIGNRAASGNGNFFAVRLSNDGYVSAEVDQDAQGTNYIGFRSAQNGLNDGNWHHVAVVRYGNTLTLYIDGAWSNSGTGAGVANINNNVVFKVGRSLVDPNTPRFAPDGVFDDVAIYNSAISADQVNALYQVATNQ